MWFLTEKSFFLIFSMLFISALYETSWTYILTTESNYGRLVKTRFFVDKTLFIEKVLQDSPHIFISAPHRMGKSSNLDMLKRFFEVQATTTDDGNITGKIENTTNYEIFVGRDLEISHNKETMDKHFGKYPVIFANFARSLNAETFMELLNTCKYSIRSAFQDHEYLINSTKLSDNDKTIYKRWYTNMYFGSLTKSEVTEGLSTLSQFLFMHFNKKCIILIDEIDSLMYETLYTDKTLFTQEHLDFYSSIFEDILQQNHIHVERVIVTGLTPILMHPLFGGSNLQYRRYFENEEYREFNGFTKADVEYLLNKFKRPEEERKTVANFYNSYTFGNSEHFNTRSIILYLWRKEIRTYWLPYGCVWNLEQAVEESIEIRNALENLLRNNSFEINYLKLTMENTQEIKQYMKNFRKNGFMDFWFSILIDYGYFETVSEKKHVPNELNKIRIKFVISDVVQEEFSNELLHYYENRDPKKFDEIRFLQQTVRKGTASVIQKSMNIKKESTGQNKTKEEPQS